MTNIPAAVETYQQHKAALLEEFPELAEDEEALRDTLEGITDVHEIVGSLAKRAREDEANAAAVDAMAAEYQGRVTRFKRRAARRREMILRLMQAVDLKRIDRPEATIARTATPAKVIVPDPSVVPDEFCRVEKRPVAALIKAKLEAGEKLNWATMSEPGETVRITR